MNYYQFHIADWALHTSHLSLEEEGVYRRLLDHYYDTESPIPEETNPVIRRLRLRGYEESVALILEEFFVLEADGWHNKRADREINAYQQKAEQARANGKRGGRPKKNNDVESQKPRETQQVISGNPGESESKANQEPRTINQEPIKPCRVDDAPTELTTANPPKKRFAAKAMDLPPTVDRATWERWCEFRTSKRKSISEEAARGQTALLSRYPPDVQAAMVQNSIQNDYQGLFPPKGAPSHENRKPAHQPFATRVREQAAAHLAGMERANREVPDPGVCADGGSVWPEVPGSRSGNQR